MHEWLPLLLFTDISIALWFVDITFNTININIRIRIDWLLLLRVLYPQQLWRQLSHQYRLYISSIIVVNVIVIGSLFILYIRNALLLITLIIIRLLLLHSHLLLINILQYIPILIIHHIFLTPNDQPRPPQIKPTQKPHPLHIITVILFMQVSLLIKVSSLMLTFQ